MYFVLKDSVMEMSSETYFVWVLIWIKWKTKKIPS